MMIKKTRAFKNLRMIILFFLIFSLNIMHVRVFNTMRNVQQDDTI
jgi:hypothetical protein